jgi:hypothetical protein
VLHKIDRVNKATVFKQINSLQADVKQLSNLLDEW